MSKASIHFHETFPPEREHISRLLVLADNMDFMTKKEIFGATGIPTGKSSGKVVPHIKYAQYMGLLQVQLTRGKYMLTKTPVGHIVAREDPYLTKTLSQLLCHFALTSKTGAAVWHFLFKEYLGTHGTIVSRADIERSSQTRFATKVNLSPFVSCYTRTTSFGPLRLLKISNNRDSWHFAPCDYNRSFRYLYAFTLLHEWDQYAPNEQELIIEELDSRLTWGASFIWDSTTILDVLTALQDMEVVKLNRQLEPFTVIRLMRTDYALQNLYSLLI